MSGQGEAPRVLAVDDAEQLTETYRVRLQDAYGVDVATSGEQALPVIENGYVVVLLDSGDDLEADLGIEAVDRFL